MSQGFIFPPNSDHNKNIGETGGPELFMKKGTGKTNEQWRNLQTILSLFRNTGAMVTLHNVIGLPEDVRVDCQDEPHLIATDPDEADAILDMWQAGK
jgi:hypothetical protein